MYMIGQLASLRDEIITIEALHEDVCGKGTRRLEELVPEAVLVEEPHPEPCDVAIIGMACYYPESQRSRRVLAEHPRPGASGHGDPRDALGLAALL